MNSHSEKTLIEIVNVKVNKGIPLEVYKKLHHFSYYAELMEKLEKNKILWDPEQTSLYSEQIAEAEWRALEEGWIGVYMTLPKEWVNGKA